MIGKFNNVEFPKFAVCRFNYENKLTALLVKFGGLSYGALDLLEHRAVVLNLFSITPP